MFEELSARTRATLRHGAEGAARLRGEWTNAGRQIYHDAIREGRDVVARTEHDIEALGRDAMDKAARLKARTRSATETMRQGVEAGRDLPGQAANDAKQAVRRAGSASARILSNMGAQVSAGQQMEREVIAPATADIAGKIWSAPNTLAGMAYGGAGHAVGLAMGTKPYVAVGANAIQFRNNPFGGVGAVTLGNTTTYSEDPTDPRSTWVKNHRAGSVPVWEHERQHTIQGQQLGPLYLPSNALGGGLALLRDRDSKNRPNWHGPSNWNEWGPQETPPVPWARRVGR